MATLISPYQYFADPQRARPIFNGFIYIGRPDGDPTNPDDQIKISVICECGGDPVNITQPVRTGPGGIPVYNGSPAQINVPVAEFSITVQDKDRVQVYHSPRVTGFNQFSADNAVTHATRADAVSDTNANRTFISTGDGWIFERDTTATSVPPLGFQDAAGNYFGLWEYSEIPEDSTINVVSDFATLHEAIVFLSGKRFSNSTVTVQIQETKLTATTPLIIEHADGVNLRIVGTSSPTRQITIGTIEGGGSGSQNVSVTLTLTSTPIPVVGDWVIVRDTTGSNAHTVAQGIWQVTNVTSNTLTYIARSWSTNVDSAAITSGTVTKIPTVLNFNNTDGVVSASSNIGFIDWLAIIGNSDEYWSSSDISGTERGTHGIYCSGLSVPQRGAFVDWNNPSKSGGTITTGENVGVNGFDQQGIVCDQGGAIFCYFAVACNNRRRGFYSAGGKIRNKFSIANGNFTDGMISDYGAGIESSGAICSGNGGAGILSTNGSSITIPNSTFQANNYNARANKDGYLSVESCTFTNAQTRDVWCERFGVVIGTGSRMTSTENVRLQDGSRGYFNNGDFTGTTHIRADDNSVVVHSGSNASSIVNNGSIIRNNSVYANSNESGNVQRSGFVYATGEIRALNSTNAGLYARISVSSIGNAILGTGMGNHWSIVNSEGHFTPENDNLQNLGSPTKRLKTIYSVTGSINTSDEREKQIESIPDKWYKAAINIHAIRYKWLNGGNRWHIGYGAQSVYKACIDAGIDNPWELSFLCKDQLTKEENNLIVPIVDEITGDPIERWGLRVDELNTLKIAAINFS